MSPPSSVARLACFSLTVRRAARLNDFYERALGFHVERTARHRGEPFESLMGVRGGATVTTLALGRERIELVEFDEPGSPYPPGASAADLIFQHFAIVVSNIGRAYERLLAMDGWTPISIGGPQSLPASSGGVSAYKFRDPEGHPLELLAFPAGRAPPRWANRRAEQTSLGVDHSAVSVADTQASCAFYGGVGLSRSGGSFNSGPQQDRLDGLEHAQAQVTALVPNDAADGEETGSGPHLELLCYARRPGGPRLRTAGNDVAATRLVFEEAPDSPSPGGFQPRAMADPDGHRLIIRPPTTA